MKTILIPVYDSFIARNLLRTEVLPTLLKAGFRVVVVPPKGKEEYYAQEYGPKGVVLETGTRWQHDRWEFLWNGLFLHSIPTRFMRIRQRDWYLAKRRYVAYAVVRVLWHLGHLKAWRWFLRNVSNREPIPAYLYNMFDRWQPDIIFAPTMITRDEVGLMRIARERGVRTVGMFKSWDNPTSKAFLRFFPDTILCHTDFMVEEAHELGDYPVERMFVSGVPQYDCYTDPSFIEDRQTFFTKLGLDPQKKLITFGPAGDWMNPNDASVLQQLVDWINAEGIPAQVLVRLHPGYESATEHVKSPHVIIERPGKYLSSNLKEVEIDDKEMRHLAATLAHSDIVINTASTLTIEASIFDTPTILIGYDGDKNLPYWDSVIRYYDREHYVNIVRANGAKLVRSKLEFLDAVRTYLKDPSQDALGRTRICREQGFRKDGLAGRALGAYLADQVY